SHDADEPVITASLYKLAVLAEAERRDEAGQLHYGDVITIESEDITEDGSFEVAGTELTLDQALEAMITISDNGAALALWHVLGADNINATLRNVGINDFHVFLAWGDDANVATPRAIGTLLTLLAKRQLIVAAHHGPDHQRRERPVERQRRGFVSPHLGDARQQERAHRDVTRADRAPRPRAGEERERWHRARGAADAWRLQGDARARRRERE